MSSFAAPPSAVRLALVVRGIVQGVGFRPFVYRLARQLELAGWVANAAEAVEIEVQGPPEAVERFAAALKAQAPPQARIDEVATRTRPLEADEPFVIRPSQADAGPDAVGPRPTIPADLATCAACAAEIATPGARRRGYPFTNCTNCGPRWSIVRGVPYDRPRTSMAGFDLCPDCRREYEDPSDRRFHAQPVACPACGPQLHLLAPAGTALAARDEALAQAVRRLLRGEIVALKGLGGFQLLVDATNQPSVERLRQRKRRPAKPFAVMFADVDDLTRECLTGEAELAELRSPAAPIVLLRRTGRRLAPAVAPANPYVGAMLPYTPLHHLLLRAAGRPLVCTSGNLAEEPMAVDRAEALDRLGPVADAILDHDRPIVRPVDDSVVQLGPVGPIVLRRARGYAPLPIELDRGEGVVVATGGHLKNAVALLLGRQAILGGHVGDLDNVASVEVHRRGLDDLLRFFDARPTAVACDLHPDYASTRTAEALAAQFDVPLYRVQHHQAHVAAVMAEHRLAGPVLGLAWDGTGYGPDGTVWGGEAMVADASGDFRRVARLRPFPLVGGDRAAREPRRSALGLLYEIDRIDRGGGFAADELRPLAALLRNGRAPRTSSMGRLFDGVAALCGLPAVVSFEGEAAMALEYQADPECRQAYALPLEAAPAAAAPAEADWRPMLATIVADRAAGVPVATIAARFHNALAELAAAIARREGIERVCLSGGCFQNAVLAAGVYQTLTRAGFRVYLPRYAPPGDGGIALGQAWIAGRLQGAPRCA